MQTRADELGVKLDWTPSCMPKVMIDPEGIHRAVLNIVTNAIDASEGPPGGRVTVATEWDAEPSIARISVLDNGVGIDQSEIDSIFQIFASSKGSRGTGLGLPVSRKIIREHGGSITVTSSPGKGACFVIELPMTRRVDPKGTTDGLTISKSTLPFPAWPSPGHPPRPFRGLDDTGRARWRGKIHPGEILCNWTVVVQDRLGCRGGDSTGYPNGPGRPGPERSHRGELRWLPYQRRKRP